MKFLVWHICTISYIIRGRKPVLELIQSFISSPFLSHFTNEAFQKIYILFNISDQIFKKETNMSEGIGHGKKYNNLHVFYSKIIY